MGAGSLYIIIFGGCAAFVAFAALIATALFVVGRRREARARADAATRDPRVASAETPSPSSRDPN